MPYVEGMWEEAKNTKRTVLIGISEINNTEKQNMEATCVRENFCDVAQHFMQQLGGGIWRITYRGSQERNCVVAIQRLKGVRRNNERGICPICGKEEDWSHVHVCERTKV
jgi:hypothetical protein